MVKVVLVGAGDRADEYAKYALLSPEKMQVVGIVDPDKIRNDIMREKYSVPIENCFSSVEEFVKRDKFADAVINGTMDQLHVVTSIPILKKGYDMLLEKPFAVNIEEMKELVDTVKETGRRVYICHVLRYAPFYREIKKHVMAGEIGDIISIQLDEHVSYHHMAVSYVRGKWRSEKVCFAPMLLAKSCHDMDIMMWMLSGAEPVSVASFGGAFQFTPKNKPENAGTRCMVDCPINEECPFSAQYNYVEPQRWEQYVWKPLEAKGYKWTLYEPIDGEQKEILEDSLKTYNDFGKCVWDFERDGNVDHQAVIVNFDNGATGVFNMVGGAPRGVRNIQIIGTKGEIKNLDDCRTFAIRTIDPKEPRGCKETIIDIKEIGDNDGMKGAHGGGDIRLIKDFCDALEGAEKSISCTEIMDSTKSHYVVFKAEESRKSGKIISLTREI